jgi:hypothetical protein
MSETLKNPALRDSIVAYYRHLVDGFKAAGTDLCSPQFLAACSSGRVFPYLDDGGDKEAHTPLLAHRTALIAAGFSEEIEDRTRSAVNAFYPHPGDMSLEDTYLEMVADFAGYLLSRCAGLSHEEEAQRLGDLCKKFDDDLYDGDSFALDSFAILRGVKHHGHFQGHLGFWLHHAVPPPLSLGDAHVRDTCLPHIELTKAPRGPLDEPTYLLLLHYDQSVRRAKDAISDAHRLSSDAFRKFVLAIRLITGAPAYCDYYGFRCPGYYSCHNLAVYPTRDETFQWDDSPDLAFPDRLSKLLDCLMPLTFERLGIVDWKINDAFRRADRIDPFERGRVTRKHAEIEQLLDYIQLLEAIVGVEGSYQIAQYTALLMAAHQPSAEAEAKRVFDFIKEMMVLRNHVVHGRLTKVLGTNSEKAIDIYRMKVIVHELAIQFIANLHQAKNLSEFAHELSIRQPISLNRI